MCNEKHKRKTRGPNKPKLTQYEKERRAHWYNVVQALKDRPPGCRCIYKKDTCPVCRPHLFQTSKQPSILDSIRLSISPKNFLRFAENNRS